MFADAGMEMLLAQSYAKNMVLPYCTDLYLALPASSLPGFVTKCKREGHSGLDKGWDKWCITSCRP